MTRSPRFAVIVSRFPKFTETFILQELRGLEDRGLEFELYALHHESAEQMQPEALELDGRAHYLGLRDRATWAAQWHWMTRRPGRYLRAWIDALWMVRTNPGALVRTPVAVVLAAAMARRMDEQSIDRVHAHWATYPTVAAYVIRRLTGIPYSFTGHAHDIFISYGGLDRKVRAADLVLTCTDFGRRHIIESAGEECAEKVHVVHHGVRLERFEQSPLPDRTADRRLRIICVAALEEYKGHRDLIDAVAQLVGRGVDASLELIGEGDRRPHLEEQVRRLGLAGRVVLRGRQPSDEVRTRLIASDVFALASIQLDSGFQDGIPNVLVEALAIGRPVVASGLPGISELITDGETGLLSRPHDPASVADALGRIADDLVLTGQLVAAGRARVEAEHDAERCLDEVHRRLAELPGRLSDA